MKYPFKIPEFYFHFYKDFDSWALAASITTMNAHIQIFPFWISISWRGL